MFNITVPTMMTFLTQLTGINPQQSQGLNINHLGRKSLGLHLNGIKIPKLFLLLGRCVRLGRILIGIALASRNASSVALFELTAGVAVKPSQKIPSLSFFALARNSLSANTSVGLH